MGQDKARPAEEMMYKKAAAQQKIQKCRRVPTNLLWSFSPFSLPDPPHTLLSPMQAARAH